MLLENKNIIITGCNRGIGKSILEIFVKNGANIFACTRVYNEDFNAFCRQIENDNNKIINIYFDLFDENAIKVGIKEIFSYKKNIDVLVNNAGISGENRLFAMTTMEEMRKVFQVNFFAPTLITQLVSRYMARKGHGNIINISSVAGLDGDLAQYEYCASKAAVIGGTKKLAAELAGFGIRVNSIAPGITKTDMSQHVDEKIRADELSRVMMGRLGKVEEIGGAALFLASDLSSFITGQILRVDGGKK